MPEFTAASGARVFLFALCIQCSNACLCGEVSIILYRFIYRWLGLVAFAHCTVVCRGIRAWNIRVFNPLGDLLLPVVLEVGRSSRSRRLAALFVEHKPHCASKRRHIVVRVGDEMMIHWYILSLLPIYRCHKGDDAQILYCTGMYFWRWTSAHQRKRSRHFLLSSHFWTCP